MIALKKTEPKNKKMKEAGCYHNLNYFFRKDNEIIITEDIVLLLGNTFYFEILYSSVHPM